MGVIKFTEEEAAAMNEAMSQDSKKDRRDAIELFKKDPEAAIKKYPFYEEMFIRLFGPKK